MSNSSSAGKCSFSIEVIDTKRRRNIPSGPTTRSRKADLSRPEPIRRTKRKISRAINREIPRFKAMTKRMVPATRMYIFSGLPNTAVFQKSCMGQRYPSFSAIDLEPRAFQYINDRRRDVDAYRPGIGGRDGLLLHIQGAGLIPEELIVVPSNHVLVDDIKIPPHAQVQVRFQRAVMIEDIDPLCGIVEVDKAALIADNGGVGDGIEQLPEVAGLVHQRTVIANPFENGIQLVEHPDIVVISQAHSLHLEDI